MKRYCYDCGLEYKNYTELADHILSNTNTHKDGVQWASRYKAGIRHPKFTPEPVKVRRRLVNKNGEPICSICHLPIGKQDQKHCCC